MKKTFLYMTLIACMGLSACTINIGDRNSGNDKKKETKIQNKILIINNSNQQSTSGVPVRVYVDAIGIYYTAIGKEKPREIQKEELKNFLRTIQETDSCCHVVLRPDEFAEYVKVRYVMRIAQELNMNLILTDDTAIEPKDEPWSEPKPLPAPPTPSAPPIEQPKQKPSEKPQKSEEDIIAIREQHIADSIAEEQAKAMRKAADMLVGLSFSDCSEAPSEGNGVCGKMAPGQGERGNDMGYALSGRYVIGNLPQPYNDLRQEGKVVVQIRVNPEGKVIEATHIGGSISDSRTVRYALDAAKKARFSPSKSDYDQIGTITYLFKNK